MVSRQEVRRFLGKQAMGFLAGVDPSISKLARASRRKIARGLSKKLYKKIQEETRSKENEVA